MAEALRMPEMSDQAPSGWQRSSLPEGAGTGFADRHVLESGLALSYLRYAPTRPFRESSDMDYAERHLTLAIALQGRCRTVASDGSHMDFLAGHSTWGLFRQARGQRQFLADEPVQHIRLIASESLLQRYGLEQLLATPEQPASAGGANTRKSSYVLQQQASALVQLHLSAAGPLELHIAALRLLAEQASLLRPAPVAGASACNAALQEKVLAARDLLHQQYDQTLSVAYLCAAVGTNECSLKQGFMSLLGTSPHRLLTAIRMQKARELLQAGHQVATVAYRVGYQHPSSFSTAFQRYYGEAPKALRP